MLRSRRHPGVLGLIVAAALSSGAACTARPSPPPPPTRSPASAAPGAPSTTTALAWGPCTTEGNRAYDCATLSVPLDHAHPEGRHIDLALIRNRASDPTRRIGSLLFNPGGPGEPTVEEFAGYVPQLSSALRARFDIIGFDPRGVGLSAPVHCLPPAEFETYLGLDSAPTDPPGLQALQAAAQRFTQACAARSGDLLPFVGTADAARDMDLIRAAVGDDTLTYLGFSYGTFLGAQYAEEFPARVRALLLDGAVDPTLSALDQNAVQAKGFQDVLSAFLADCKARGSACKFRAPSGDLLAAYRAVLEKVRRTTLPTTLTGRRLLPGEGQSGALDGLYSRQTWPVLAAALQEAADGDGTLLLRIADTFNGRQADGSYFNVLEANAAVNCRDSAAPPDLASYIAAGRAAAVAAPDFGLEVELSSLVCASWPVHGVPHPPLAARGAAPILVVGTTNDPATPYSEAVGLSRQLTSAVLLTRVGDEHTAYSGSACARRYSDDYLIRLAVPPQGSRCAS